MTRHRVIAFPRGGISYNDSFYKEVEAKGVEVIEGVFSGGWLWANVRRGDWVHLHWPSFGYSTKGGGVSLAKTYLRWLALLLVVRLRGGRLIWTAHNLLPHDRARWPWLDVLARHVVIAMADLIPVHGENAAAALVARFPAAKPRLLQIPHGHWIGYYPVTQSREEARRELGVEPGRRMFLFIGLCKPYKNLDGLVRAFRELPGDAVLVVAGKFPDRDYLDLVAGLADGDPRIVLHPGFVADDRMQTYLHACDYVVVPYREILTSGTAMLALSFGRPVISVALGFLKDVVTVEVGLLFAPDDPEGLRGALLRALDLRFDERQILEIARGYDFADAAMKFVSRLDALTTTA